MKIAARRLLAVVLVGSLVAMAGCTGGDSCGNVLTIMAKLGPEKNIGALSACEWQVLFAELPSLAQTFGVDLQGITVPPLSDEAAQAIVDFLAANGVTTLDSLFVLVQSGSLGIEDIPLELLDLVSSIA